jgi:hypothetical protein
VQQLTLLTISILKRRLYRIFEANFGSYSILLRCCSALLSSLQDRFGAVRQHSKTHGSLGINFLAPEPLQVVQQGQQPRWNTKSALPPSHPGPSSLATTSQAKMRPRKNDVLFIIHHQRSVQDFEVKLQSTVVTSLKIQTSRFGSYQRQAITQILSI